MPVDSQGRRRPYPGEAGPYDSAALGRGPGQGQGRALGLGLGLNRGQRRDFRQAVNAGQLDTFLAGRPNLQARFGNLANSSNPNRFGQAADAFTSVNRMNQTAAANAAAPPAQPTMQGAPMGPTGFGKPTTAPPPGGGMSTAGGGGAPLQTPGGPGLSALPVNSATLGGARGPVLPPRGGMSTIGGGGAGLTTPGGPSGTLASMQPGMGARGATVMPTAAAAPPGPTGFGASRGPGTTAGIVDAQFGTGGVFDPTASSFDEIANFAQQNAQRFLDQNLAGTRARFGASGFGNSARQALTEGQAIGDVASQLGGTLANLREGSRQQDVSRLLQGILGAGQIDLSRQQFQQQLPFQALQGLSQLGTGLLATGQSEQVPAFLQALLPFLTGFGQTETYGRGRSG